MPIILAALYFTALAAGYFSSVLGSAFLLTERDLAVFFIPPRILWTDILRHGEFPLWNPYSYSGHPLFATLQPGILYPLNVFLLILPFDLAFNWLIIAHFVMAGTFTFILLRELKAGYAGALTGGTVIMLGGYLFSTHNVMSTLFSVAWAPLAVFTFLRAMRRGSWGWAAATGVVLAVMFMGGGIEVVFGSCGLILFITLLPRSMDTLTDGAAFVPLKTRLVMLGFCAGVFLLLSAVQLLPFLELARLSTRAGGLSWHEATTWSFDLKDLVAFFIPDPYGYGVSSEKYWANQSWLKTVYMGSAPFMLAYFYLRDGGRRVWTFMLLAALAMLMSMGRNNALYPALYAYAPFFSKFRFPVKFLFLVFLLASIAAGSGYDAFKRHVSGDSRKPSKTAITLLVMATLAALGFGWLYYFNDNVRAQLVSAGMDYPDYNRVDINLYNAKRALFFFIAAALSLYAGLRSTRVRKALPYVIVGIVTVDLFFAHQGYFQSTASAEYHRSGTVMDFIKKDPALVCAFVTPKTLNDKFDTTDVREMDRFVLERMNLDKEKLQGYNLEHKVFDTTGVDVMQRADYAAFYDLIRLQKHPDDTSLISLLNVKYVVSIPEIKSKKYRLVKVVGEGLAKPDKLIKIYENLSYTPRFYTVDRYRVIKDRQAYLDALLDKHFIPAKEALLEDEPWPDKAGAPVAAASRASVSASNRNNKVEVVEYLSNSATLLVRRSTPGILVASESWYPGWQAYVDGVETKIMRADYILRAVAVPAGTHKVRFVYRPWTFIVGAWVSGAAMTGLIGWRLFMRIKKWTNG